MVPPTNSKPRDFETLLRELTPQVLGAVMRRFRDFAAAEDAVQEALLAAALEWPSAGVPANPRAWLVTVASRRVIDFIRSDAARREREIIAASEVEESTPKEIVAPETDDTLTLLFLCCHSSLTRPSAIALTLRAVGGLTTAEIARAFLVPEATMAQRISRAKASIQASGLRFETPQREEWMSRLRSVLHVLYLIFNEGYTSSFGDTLDRPELSHEAIRLARAVQALLPEDAEVGGLLALMLLTDARRLARTGPNGELIPLARQDRGLWNRAAIGEGVALLTSALARGAVGEYQLQAAIAAVHDEAQRTEDTDWPQILVLYDLLAKMSPSPVVRLNQAIAFAMVHGPNAGLARLDDLASDERLKGSHRLEAARAHLLEMAGDFGEAIHHYRTAAGQAANLPERDYLITQAARLEAARSPIVCMNDAH